MNAIAPFRRTQPLWIAAVVGLCATAGCGTTQWSDTPRTATEQLLISDAIDRAVSRIDLRALAGKQVYLDSTPIQRATDASYLVSTLRQHMLASGCILRDKREEADYVVEVRAGAVGTDRSELLFGVPATKIPQVVPMPGVPNSIPEFKLATRTEQRAVAKIALFAYNRNTGRPVWQSGVIPVESKAKDIWVLGAGPFQQGTIYDGTNFAGDRLSIPLIDLEAEKRRAGLSVAQEAFFSEPGSDPASQPGGQQDTQLAKQQPSSGAGKASGSETGNTTSGKVIPAAHAEPVVPGAKGGTLGAKPDPAGERSAAEARPKPEASSEDADSATSASSIGLRVPALLPDPPPRAKPLSGSEAPPAPPDTGTLAPEATWVVPLDDPFSAPLSAGVLHGVEDPGDDSEADRQAP